MKKRYYHLGGGYTGELFEEEILGPWRIVCQGYLPYSQALAEVIKNQPRNWNPSDPPTRIANDLHALVAINLNLDDWSLLNLFSARGSSFDIFHGVDAFFIINKTLCTLDLTISKKERAKADLVIRDEDIFEKTAMEKTSKKISEILFSKKPVILKEAIA
ncbi:MAG: hypothetical protein WC042_01560 [Candidatus Paceibacterota bacterium]|nr:hypothetical protein [Candidatus Paceibacterota bacterium]MDD3548726.1 hypothetical protein [Candidatus Paceibacterota bacterium]MDD4999103.1 hypothetical protein [Candidatus Paceibacterota bacterium]MDD5545333.1 hypothetical protein [Candidatus Paceibacterota bacterium]